MSYSHRAVALEDSLCGSARKAGQSLAISIITDCRDNSASIDHCLASVAEQTFTAVEHVVVDRHSHDDSLQRIYAQRDHLSIVYGARDDTRFEAWNRGIGQASGDVLGFLNGTDELAGPGVLEAVARAFAHPWVSAVYGDILYVHARDARHGVRRHAVGAASTARLARGWVPPTTSMFVRRSWYRRIGGFSPTFRVAADYDASLRLFSHPFFKATYLAQAITRQRLIPLQPRQLGSAWRVPIEELEALRTAQVGGWAALAWRGLSKLGTGYSVCLKSRPN